MPPTYLNRLVSQSQKPVGWCWVGAFCLYGDGDADGPRGDPCAPCLDACGLALDGACICCRSAWFREEAGCAGLLDTGLLVDGWAGDDPRSWSKTVELLDEVAGRAAEVLGALSRYFASASVSWLT